MGFESTGKAVLCSIYPHMYVYKYMNTLPFSWLVRLQTQDIFRNSANKRMHFTNRNKNPQFWCHFADPLFFVSVWASQWTTLKATSRKHDPITCYCFVLVNLFSIVNKLWLALFPCDKLVYHLFFIGSYIIFPFLNKCSWGKNTFQETVRFKSNF